MIIVLAFGLNLYIQNSLLKRLCREKRKEIREKFNRASVILEKKKELEKKRALIKNAAEEMKREKDFLGIIKVVYNILPRNSYLKGLSVEEDEVELKIKSKKPVEVLHSLSRNRSWKDVKILGPLVYKTDGYTEFVIKGNVILPEKGKKGSIE